MHGLSWSCCSLQDILRDANVQRALMPTQIYRKLGCQRVGLRSQRLADTGSSVLSPFLSTMSS
jgi:hypothetical protein